MHTKIFVMTHKPFCPPDDDIYIPMQVGKEGKEDLGYLCDNTGINISNLNCYYGELTGLFWLWQNYKDDTNVGVCHYRRYFVNDNLKLMSEEEYNSILSEYDIITSNSVNAKKKYKDYYGEFHNYKDLETLGEVIKEVYPDYYESYDEVMNQELYYYGNLMVTSHELFNKYCEWIFNIFMTMTGRIDVSNYDEYHKRIFGFLSEQLLKVWIVANKLKVYECSIGLTGEKAETSELKAAISKLVKNKEIDKAYDLFYGMISIRPDITIELSDVNGDMPAVEALVNILKVEKSMNINRLIDKNDDLSELIKYIKNLANIITDIVNGNCNQEKIDILREWKAGIADIVFTGRCVNRLEEDVIANIVQKLGLN